MLIEPRRNRCAVTARYGGKVQAQELATLRLRRGAEADQLVVIREGSGIVKRENLTPARVR